MQSLIDKAFRCCSPDNMENMVESERFQPIPEMDLNIEFPESGLDLSKYNSLQLRNEGCYTPSKTSIDLMRESIANFNKQNTPTVNR